MLYLDLRHSNNPSIARPEERGAPVNQVRSIIERVRRDGDAALRELTMEFDGASITEFRVPQKTIESSLSEIPAELRSALESAARRIKAVAEKQLLTPWRMELAGGVVGENVAPVDRAGAYVPGGRAVYPSTVLMCCIPAAAAGVPHICLCVPPARDGSVHKATLAAAAVAGVSEVFSVGGAQAIAAMALGTDQIPKVDVVVGPGNIFVATAKRELAGTVAIDSVAGPSEIAVVADGSADAVVIAHDIVAQAEHGPGGAFLVCSWDESLLEDVRKAVEKVLAESDGASEIASALEAGGVLVRVNDVEQAAAAMNAFGPEHLELLLDDAEEVMRLFTNAGAIFLGHYSPVPLGDYVAGTNHVLPTGGAARWSSGLRASTFQKTSYFIQHSRESLTELAMEIEELSNAEGLTNHSRSVRARLEDLR